MVFSISTDSFTIPISSAGMVSGFNCLQAASQLVSGEHCEPMVSNEGGWVSDCHLVR